MWGGVGIANGCRFTMSSRRVARFLVGADTLTITDVTDGDEGTYTCMMNTSLDMDSASAMLTVVGTFTLGRLSEDSAEGVKLGEWHQALCFFCSIKRFSWKWFQQRPTTFRRFPFSFSGICDTCH